MPDSALRPSRLRLRDGIIRVLHLIKRKYEIPLYTLIVLGDGDGDGDGKAAAVTKIRSEQNNPTSMSSYYETLAVNKRVYKLEIQDMTTKTATYAGTDTGTDTGIVADDMICVGTSVSYTYTSFSHSSTTNTATDIITNTGTSQGYLLIYNVSSRSTFGRIQQLFQQVEQARTTHAPLPVVIVGNGCDGHNREVSVDEGANLAMSLGCQFMETSAEAKNVALAVGAYMVGQLQVAQQAAV